MEDVGWEEEREGKGTTYLSIHSMGVQETNL